MESGDISEQPCDYFFSTMPMKHLFEMMSPKPPAEVLRVSRGLQYRDFLTVGLLLNKLHVQEMAETSNGGSRYWIYVQDTGVHVDASRFLTTGVRIWLIQKIQFGLVWSIL